jgi:hypothetical protein
MQALYTLKKFEFGGTCGAERETERVREPLVQNVTDCAIFA